MTGGRWVFLPWWGVPGWGTLTGWHLPEIDRRAGRAEPGPRGRGMAVIGFYDQPATALRATTRRSKAAASKARV